MLPAEDAIERVTEDVFAAFGFSTERAATARYAEGVTSTVDIDGPEPATVGVELPWTVASHLTAEVLGSADSSPPEALVYDLTAEIANMIGGNLKGLMCGPCRLSLPIARQSAPEDLAREPNRRTVAFECALGSFAVTVTAHASQEDLP